MYQANLQKIIQILNTLFTDQVRIVYPHGGYLLWVAFKDQNIDTTALLKRCMQRGVSFIPGEVESLYGDYQYCMRISFTHEDIEFYQSAFQIIKEELDKLQKEKAN